MSGQTLFASVCAPLRALAVALSATTLACADASLGGSALLDTQLSQSLLGPFEQRPETFVTDLDGDGLDDVIVYPEHLGRATVHSDDFHNVTSVVYDPPPAYLSIYYGVAGGLALRTRSRDADAVVTLRPGEVVERWNAADVDGDGVVEFVVFARMSFRDDPAPGGAYVLPRGPRLVGSVALNDVAQRVDVPRHAFTSLRMQGPSDLDGQPGAEFLIRAFRPGPTDVPGNLEVRNLNDGGLRATLRAPDDEYLNVLGVLDLDRDGVDDVVCGYLVSSDGATTDEQGLVVFYGPLTGERQRGDADTATVVRPGLYDLYSEVVGNYLGDAGPDLVAFGFDEVVGIPSGARYTDETLTAALVRIDALADIQRMQTRYSPTLVRVADADGDGFDELVTLLGDDVVQLDRTGVVARRVPLRYGDGTAADQYLDHHVADVDGDGRSDLVVGIRTQATRSRSTVHVLYGFGG